MKKLNELSKQTNDNAWVAIQNLSKAKNSLSLPSHFSIISISGKSTPQYASHEKITQDSDLAL